MPFYRRRWDESRGDQYDDWGPAVYYFWIHDGRIEQQVELYDSGVMLAYDRYHRADQYGQLAVEPLDATEWSAFKVDIGTYQREVDRQPFNKLSWGAAIGRSAQRGMRARQRLVSHR